MAAIRMTLCPQCKSIQKAGESCPLCKYPIPLNPEEAKEVSERRTQGRRQQERRITGKEFLDKE